MRELTSHKVNGCNDGITITVRDEPGAGGAHHLYRCEYDNPKWGPDPQSMRQVHEIAFQNGPIKENGTNGLTHEVLLAILEDRLDSFQRGPFACMENHEALIHIQEAQRILKARTEKRLARGVEGTHQV